MNENEFQTIIDNQYVAIHYLQLLLSLEIIIGIVLIINVWMMMKRNAIVDQIQRWIKYEKIDPEMRQK